MSKLILITGGSGFIGYNLAKFLRNEDPNHVIIGIDIKPLKYNLEDNPYNNFYLQDLTDYHFTNLIFDSFESFDEVYALAADMGGAGYIFSGHHDADVMSNSALINLNTAKIATIHRAKRLFYSSSACVYPEHNQLDPNNPNCEESSAYPANPDSEYGWEKLFSERLYFSFARNYGLNVKVGRFHNVYGEYSEWNNGKEKSPAAICRKVIQAENNGTIDIWGDGEQTRSYLYIDDCLEAMVKFIRQDEFNGPLNIGSEEMVTINKLVEIACSFDNKKININHIDGPLGVRGRCSHNSLIKEKLNWTPKWCLEKGLEQLYRWIEIQNKNEIASNI